MLCCALGLLALVTGASARGLRALLGAWPVAILAGGAVTVLAVLVPHHLEHYRQRARAHDRTVLAEIVAAPLCSGRPSRSLAPG
ncbi:MULTISPECIES: hypothetical protein [Caulobacter]|jgi:hypothetical protein|uniref:Uncharacterized protein n=1 Tax=Caulobacter rhizosphaerae TaxID=2010972 RepID=A0ABU1N5P7_9CAUL|nr:MULTISPECIES: hypothetical protein [Caulobacter]KQZ33982.1 hypothetical protein ASD47_02605 [Caulobacter sp. Root1472]MDR6533753.1 hypothetical protein [Caulobacter rhizosphaerae]GGL13619.1 hypothetical protein GCM10010983_08530 [Caulobacter rhizosphaerae]